jgi:O-antigen/teichoic acid export membrane protein
MSLKRNILANFIGQIYLIITGIVIAPLYLQYLGAESYGLFGIFLLMQAWMSVLDVGISPTLGRQAAVMRGRGGCTEDFWVLLKSFEVIFMGLAVLMITGVFMASSWISKEWINFKSLELSSVVSCLQIMGVLIGLRWFAALYRSGINGLEDQVWLNVCNIIIISLKFLGALILVATVTNEILDFFIYQLVIGCAEVLVLMWRLYSRIDKLDHPRYIAFDWPMVKSVMPFATGIAYTSAIWILTSQTDKLIFSRVLPLGDFGYYTLVTLVAGGIVLINSPIVQALTPRLIYFYTKGENEKLIDLYRDTSQITAVIVLCVASMVALYAKPLLFAWTGDMAVAEWGGDVLFWFALGNAVMVISANPFYLQKAMGKLKWHVIGSTLMVVMQLPLIYWVATNYDAASTGRAWLIFMSVWFLLWTAFLHRQLIPGFHQSWIFYDILPVLVTVLGVAWLQNMIFNISYASSRLSMIFELVLIGLAMLITCSISTRLVRNAIAKQLKELNA